MNSHSSTHASSSRKPSVQARLREMFSSHHHRESLAEPSYSSDFDRPRSPRLDRRAVAVILKALESASEVDIGHALDRTRTELLPCRLPDGTNDTIVDCVGKKLRHCTTPHVRAKLFAFLVDMVKYQRPYLEMSRPIIFRLLADPAPGVTNNPRNSAIAVGIDCIDTRLTVLQTITQDGKDIQQFANELPQVLVDWLAGVSQQCLTSQDKTDEKGEQECHQIACQLLDFTAASLKHNATYFDEATLKLIMHVICVFAFRSSSFATVESCMTVLKQILMFSIPPMENDSQIGHLLISALAKLVNRESLAKTVWVLMKMLLGTHVGHRVQYIMCELLEASKSYPDHEVIRGCIVFLGMSLWSAQRVTSLKHTPSSVLGSLRHALDTDNVEVVSEVCLQLERLVDKFGGELQLMAWDLLVQLLEEIYRFGEAKRLDQSHRLMNTFHRILTRIEEYNKSHTYNGSPELVYGLVAECAKHRPENSVQNLLDYSAENIGPGRQNWLGTLLDLQEKYYIHDARVTVRLKALDVLRRVYGEHRRLYADAIVDNVILKLCHMHNVANERDYACAESFSNLLIDVAKDLKQPLYYNVVNVIENILNHRLQTSFSKHRGEEVSELFDLLRNLSSGCVELVQAKWPTSSAAHGVHVLQVLSRSVLNQYRFAESAAADTQALIYEQGQSRSIIFDLLTQLRVNDAFEVGIQIPSVPGELQLVYSHYVVQPSSSPTPSPHSPPPSPSPVPGNALRCVDMAGVLTAVVKCLRVERAWPVLELVLRRLPTILEQRRLVRHHKEEMVSLCQALVTLAHTSAARVASLVDSSSFSDSALQGTLYASLSGMVAYHSLIGADMKLQLCTCIQHGLVSQHSSAPLLATINCALQMQEVMVSTVSDLLVRLADIPASAKFAISSLELLDTLARLPKTSSFKFNEIDYFKIFSVLLQYVDATRFTTFIVAHATHLIFVWFLLAPIPVRVKMASKILDSLDATQSAVSREGPSDEKDRSLQADIRTVIGDFLSLFTFGNAPATQSNRVTAEVFGAKGDPQTTRSWRLGDRVVTITLNDQTRLANSCPMCCGASLTTIRSSTRELMERRKDSESSQLSSETDRRRRHRSARQPQEPPVQLFHDEMEVDRRAAEAAAAVKDGVVNRVESTASMVRFDLPDQSLTDSDDSLALDVRSLQSCPCATLGWVRIVVRRVWAKLEFVVQLDPDQYRIARDAVMSPATPSPQKHSDTVTTAPTAPATVIRRPTASEPPSSLRDELHVDTSSTAGAEAAPITNTSVDTAFYSTVSRNASAARFHSASTPQVVAEHVPAALLLQLFYSLPVGLDPSPCTPVPVANPTMLDFAPSKAFRKIGVIYIAPGQLTKDDIFKNAFGSDRYERFVSRLGAPVCLKEEDAAVVRAMSGMSPKDAPYAMLWTSAVTEVIFHVATMMSKQSRVREIFNDYVAIIYNDGPAAAPEQLVRNAKFNFVSVVVEPVDDDMLAVSVRAKDEVSRWLALKSAVVPDHVAPVLCREIAARAELSANIWWQNSRKEPPFISRSLERLRQIRRMTAHGGDGQSSSETARALAALQK